MTHTQVIGPGAGEAFLKLRLKDQAAALHLLDTDPALAGLTHVRAPLVDVEVRGVPALQYFGGVVWQPEVFEKLNAGGWVVEGGRVWVWVAGGGGGGVVGG